MISALLVVEKLKAQFADGVQEVTEAHGELTVVVSRDQIVEICRLLKTDPTLRYDLLLDVAGVDYLGRELRFEVVYHLYSLPHNSRLRLKVQVPDGDATAICWGSGSPGIRTSGASTCRMIILGIRSARISRL